MREGKGRIAAMLKEACILFAITMVAGLALGYVYELTKEPIAYQKELKVQKACEKVFAEASYFEEVTGDKDDKTEAPSLFQALGKEGELLGYVLQVTTEEGYGGNITIMMGISMDGTLNGISLLSISETPGLGMRAEEVLVPQFANKNVSEFMYTKTGAVTEEQIDAISGATVTTRAITNAVNAGLHYFEQELKEGGNRNEK